ncbi:MAG: hypothetical protein IT385_02165 [Deltaproteobacteria bacterium]|nr:hypothetical protein [Deltaproteobacteria bacterium]
MSDDQTPTPTLGDVLIRLDRLEALLDRLVDLAARQQGTTGAAVVRPAPPPPPAPSAVVAPPPSRPEPPVIEVAPPVGAPSAAPHVGLGLELRRDYDPYGFRTDIQVPGAGATIHQVLTAVFEAGLRPEPEDTWAMMTKLTHASQMVGPRALDHFKAFAWHKLRRTASTYLKNNDPSSFIISYTDPPEVSPEVDRVRVFIRAGENRMPVPVAVARDATQDGAWRLTMISL